MRVELRRGAPTVVDDRDLSIKYGEGWSLGSDPKGNDGTVTTTTVDGAFATYEYTGTNIRVFGQRLPADHINATFNLDGTTTSYIKPNAENLVQHQVCFFTGNVSDGPHTLVITNHGQSLLLDFFEVILDAPSPGSQTTATDAQQGTTSETPELTTSMPPPLPSTSTTRPAEQTTTTTRTTSDAGGTTSGVGGSSNAQQTSQSSGGPNTSPVMVSSPTTPGHASPTTSLAGPSASDTGSANAVKANSSSSDTKVLGPSAYAAIAAGVAALLSALAAWWWWRRRMRKQSAHVTPFDAGELHTIHPEKYDPPVSAGLGEDGKDDSETSGRSGSFPAYGYRRKERIVPDSDSGASPLSPPAHSAAALAPNRMCASSQAAQGRFSGTTVALTARTTPADDVGEAEDVVSSVLSAYSETHDEHGDGAPSVSIHGTSHVAPYRNAGTEKAGVSRRARRRSVSGGDASRVTSGSNRHSVDGGVRLAGGPLDTAHDEAGWDAQEELGRPPPYNRY